MKTNWTELEQFRARTGDYRSGDGDTFGAFFIPWGRDRLFVIASSGEESMPWEHVSAHVRGYKGPRTPTWDEMCRVKAMFWEPEECVVQFHPPESEYVNQHPHVLHLWKPVGIELPRPPRIAV